MEGLEILIFISEYSCIMTTEISETDGTWKMDILGNLRSNLSFYNFFLLWLLAFLSCLVFPSLIIIFKKFFLSNGFYCPAFYH